ncbi:hypothetical protein [Enterocloster sp.]|uniref:hypothetical protein n=1 Tax=Enterocloster sp. TaxID=2719315 RepID=UPI0039A19CBD
MRLSVYDNHTTLGTMGAEQADYLIDGVRPEDIIIGHMVIQDVEVILDVLKRGVNVA